MLTKRGIKVSAQYVSTIKANDRRKAAQGITPRRPGRPPKAKRKNQNGELTQAADLLVAAIDLVTKAGGAAEARELVTMADKIVGKMS